jgi:low affinity Fe/Cu permease
MTFKPKELTPLEKISFKITDWMGSPTSLLVHTAFFIGIFVLYFFGFQLDQIMLILTTVVSLEAIYLSLLIQMTVNRNTQSLQDVEKDIDEIQEDVEDIQEDVTEIGDDVEEISKDVDEIQEDVEDIQEDVPEVHTYHAESTNKTLESIESQLLLVMKELEELKKKSHD